MRMWFKEERYAWVIVCILWIFGFLGSIGRVIVQYFQGAITEDIGITRAFIGYSWSSSILIASLCSPFGGWITDKFGYKTTMILGSVLGIISGVVIVAVPHPIGYFIGFGILGGLAGIAASTSYVVVSQWFKHHRAKALMIIGSASSLGLAILTPIIVSNEHWLTWSTAYKIRIAIGLASIVLIVFLIKDRSKRVEGEDADEANKDQPKAEAKPGLIRSLSALRKHITNPALIVVLFALFTCGFSMGTVEMHLMAIQQEAHVSHSMFIASLSILGVLELVGGFVFSVLLDKMPRAIALSCLYLIRTIAFTILFFHFYLSPVLFTLIFGATYLGAIPGGILLANESLKTKSVGLQTGALLSFHQLGAVVAAITGGWNYDLFHNYQFLIALNIVFSIISCVGYYLVRISARTQHSENQLAVNR